MKPVAKEFHLKRFLKRKSLKSKQILIESVKTHFLKNSLGLRRNWHHDKENRQMKGSKHTMIRKVLHFFGKICQEDHVLAMISLLVKDLVCQPLLSNIYYW